ncbi:hypothetical protein S14_87 [Shewanella sp. phage 1/4]|uniref:hypothetical protein n=1 Tax=Shewanella phage 1/4 TaxID=1458859 RepID=UPI0004F83B75|nr:hypothetical protein S14_87 [Shewanella sp. phage 1/4]AHK11196.1 hypothetical protein S14_87 [Shewanella sp. phage 1/4]
MQCSCGNTIHRPSYTSKSKYDYICNECKGYEVEDYDIPPSGEDLLNINLENYNRYELSGDGND